MQRVKSEQEGHQGTPPARTGETFQQREPEQRAQRVKPGVGEVMPAAVQSKEAHIQHVGEPGERKPVAGEGGAEGPREAGPAEPRLDVRIRRNVVRVVVGHEVEVKDLAVYGEDCDREQQVDPEVAGKRGRGVHRCAWFCPALVSNAWLGHNLPGEPGFMITEYHRIHAPNVAGTSALRRFDSRRP